MGIYKTRILGSLIFVHIQTLRWSEVCPPMTTFWTLSSTKEDTGATRKLVLFGKGLESSHFSHFLDFGSHIMHARPVCRYLYWTPGGLIYITWSLRMLISHLTWADTQKRNKEKSLCSMCFVHVQFVRVKACSLLKRFVNKVMGMIKNICILSYMAQVRTALSVSLIIECGVYMK